MIALRSLAVATVVACLACGACSSTASAPVPTTRWSSPEFPYEVSVPVGFAPTHVSSTRAELRATGGRELVRLELLDPTVPGTTTGPVFDVDCGSHVCTARLVMERSALRGTYLLDFDTDTLGATPTEEELGRRLDPILASARRR